MSATVASPSRALQGAHAARRWPPALLLFLAATVSLPWIALRIGPVTLSDALFAVAAVAVVLSGRMPRPSAPMQIALGLTILAVVTSSLAAVDAGESLLVGARVVYIFAVWQWVTRAVVDTPRVLRLVVVAFVIGCAVSGLAGAAQVVLAVDIPNSTVVFGRAAGLQTHPNGQGGALAIGLAAAFALVTDRSTRLVGLMGLILTAGGLVLSGSVSGMIAATIGAIVVLLRARPSVGWIVSASALGVAAWFLLTRIDILIPGAVSPVTRLLDTTGQGVGESTALTRWLTIEHAWSTIIERGIGGVGLDVASGVTYDGETAAHSILVLVLLQGGLLLLMAVLLAVTTALASLRRAFPGDVVSRVGVPAMVFTALFFALTGPVLYERWFWLPMLLAIAVAAAARRSPESTSGVGQDA